MLGFLEPSEFRCFFRAFMFHKAVHTLGVVDFYTALIAHFLLSLTEKEFLKAVKI